MNKPSNARRSPEANAIANIARVPNAIKAELQVLRDPVMLGEMSGLVLKVSRTVQSHCAMHPMSAEQRRLLLGLAASNEERFHAVHDASVDTSKLSDVDLRNALQDAHRPGSVSARLCHTPSYH
ncbi:MAG: hypothetical protein IPI58_01300 [Alphaproteobacteria bacterium]|nr:MAG: hypothetical protein IPI58_01300 [Alphaproteobacteria bacterium]